MCVRVRACACVHTYMYCRRVVVLSLCRVVMLSVVLQGAVFALFCSVNVKIVRHCKLVQIRFLYFRSIDREVFFRFLTAVLQQQYIFAPSIFFSFSVPVLLQLLCSV